jgi:hypothetical protein
MTRQAIGSTLNSLISHRPGEQRRHTRYPVQYRLCNKAKIKGKTVRGEGMLVDVSLEGCGIQGSCPVKQGECLSMEIHLPLSKVALRLTNVMIMWASGSRFGVKSVECSKIVPQLGLLPPGPPL